MLVIGVVKTVIVALIRVATLTILWFIYLHKKRQINTTPNTSKENKTSNIKINNNCMTNDNERNKGDEKRKKRIGDKNKINFFHFSVTP